MSDALYAWHFSTGTLRFQYENTPVEAGLVLKTHEAPLPEKNGFHACVSPLAALEFFAVRPNDRVIISRVRLGGEIRISSNGVIAQQREHLWVADAESTLEDFAMSHVYMALDWLRAENVTIPDILTDMLEKRRLYCAKAITQKQLFAAADELAAWVSKQKQSPQYTSNILSIEELNEKIDLLDDTEPDDWGEYAEMIFDMQRGQKALLQAVFDEDITLDQRLERHRRMMEAGNRLQTLKNFVIQRNAVHFWLLHWQALIQVEPVRLAESLARLIRHDTQFFALEVQHTAAHVDEVISNYYGWLAASQDKDADPSDSTKISQLQLAFAGWNFDLKAPEAYRSAWKSKAPDPDRELHRRLMLLAPDGYKE